MAQTAAQQKKKAAALLAASGKETVPESPPLTEEVRLVLTPQELQTLTQLINAGIGDGVKNLQDLGLANAVMAKVQHAHQQLK